MKEQFKEPVNWKYKVVRDFPKQKLTKVTTYFEEDGQIKGFQKIIKTKEFGRYF